MTNPAAFHIGGEDRPGRWLVTCDHATNRVPEEVGGDLGIAPSDMARHIAYDVGARGVARELARLLDSPCIETDFSRLVIDPNRGEDDPTLLMKLYDGTLIPRNRHADATEIERRLTLFHRPYHAALERLAARRGDVVICAVHSFTPQLRNRPRRPWQVGVLSAWDKRVTAPFIAALEASETLRAEVEAMGERLVIGDNEPYDGHLPGDSVDVHALRHGRLNLLIELRSDLIATEAGQARWAALLAPILARTLTETGL
ncbi:N-formylglutamate amidohydrolase [Celeribacter indicus]|uniref:N-formylglutamate amidohydrolase n=1 Tax=Celeribacter indicus TaxID=1208324 RepID=A0A0B5E7B3_9RHOB|nr:N-formylglutamate amidohydrolase [Celeribacter indicus]AJE48951.1 n-formylglutamate amidohydrolase [Celeribacter indicus]SDW42093.1 Predicted N-formylglutamate amidohydrolase [Celeribacter indicus]